MSDIRQGIYSTPDLEKILGNKMAIARLTERGDLTKIMRGYYSTSEIGYDAALYGICSKYFSEGIISNHTCLFKYNLSDYQDDKIHLDFPKEDGLKLANEMIQFHRVKEGRLSHTTAIKINGVTVKIYKPERAIFEALKMEKGFGNFSAQVCNNFNKEFKSYDVKLLAEIAEEFGEPGKMLLNYLLNIKENIY